MRIVVLDGFTLNPGDLNMDSLYELGECKIYDRTSQDELIERAKEAEILNKQVRKSALPLRILRGQLYLPENDCLILRFRIFGHF